MIVSSVARPRLEAAGARLDGARSTAGRGSCGGRTCPAASWPTWRSSHQQRAAQPEPSSSASTNEAGADPGAREDLLELRVVRQRMAPSDRGVGPDRREVASRGRGGRRRGCGRRRRPSRGRTSTRTTLTARPCGATSSARPRDPGSGSRSSARRARRASTQAITVGPEPGQRRAGAARRAGRRGSSSSSARRPVRLVQPVVQRGGEERSRRRSPRPAPSSAARPALAAASACGTVGGKRLRGSSRSRSARCGITRHGVERQALGDPGDPPVPGEREAAEQRCREVVGVGLEREPGREELLGARVPARRRRGRARSPQRTSRARARAGSG